MSLIPLFARADARQIARWNGVAGEKGRWRNNLINKCVAAGAAHDDVSVSPVVRQTLLHWGYELSERDLAAVMDNGKTSTHK